VWLIPAKSSSNSLTNTRCCMYSFWVPDDGRRNRLKHVQRLAEINELCNLHLVGYTWKNKIKKYKLLHTPCEWRIKVQLCRDLWSVFMETLRGLTEYFTIHQTPWYPRRVQNWHAVVSTLTRLGMVWFGAWILAGAQNYSLSQRYQTVSGAHVVLMLQDRQCIYIT
jgi:hypothetical protein